MRVQLGDIATWSKGLSIPRDNTSTTKEVPYLHYGDLYQKYGFKLDLDEQYRNIIKIDLDQKIKPEQYLHEGDIVFTLTSETVDDLGHCTLILNPGDKPFISGMETTVIHIIDKEHILPAYLNYIFHTVAFQRNLRTFVTGMKVYRVHPNDMMKMAIELPSYDEQVRVVSILDPLSDLIKINNQINDYLDQQLIIIFNQLFDKVNNFEQLGNYCDVQKGLSYKGQGLSESGALLINLGNIIPGGGFKKENNKYYSGEYKTMHKVKPGDIVIANTDMTQDRIILGSPAFVPEYRGDILFTHHLFALRETSLPKTFLYYYLKSPSFHRLCESSANGTTVLAINRNDVLSSLVPIDRDKISRFDKIAIPYIQMINNNNKQNEFLSLMRSALIKKLIKTQPR